MLFKRLISSVSESRRLEKLEAENYELRQAVEEMQDAIIELAGIIVENIDDELDEEE